MIDGVEYKLCRECEKFYPMNIENFYRKKSKDGYDSYCKKCAIEKANKHQYENYEKQLSACKKHYQTSKTYKENKKKLSKKRRDEGKYKEWQQSQRGKTASKRAQEKRKNKKHSITPKEWGSCKKYFNHQCAYCGISEGKHKEIYKQQLHKEHVIHDGRNDLKNCIPSCKVCNSEKSTQTLNEFYNTLNIDYTRERYLKIVEWIKYDVKKYIVKKRKKSK